MNTPQQRHEQRKREGFIEPPGPQPQQQENGQTAAPVIEPPPEVAAPLPEQWPVVVKLLKKPIRNNQNVLVRELKFREPTGGDINRYGNPVRVDTNGEIIIDDKKMIVMIAALSNILPPMIEQMDPRDYSSCAYRLRGFFLPDPEAWS